MVGFVAVHVGAGVIAPESEEALKAVLRDACHAATHALCQGSTSEEAAVAAVTSLENSPLTNAGLGSNLNALGCVEADASVMYSRQSGGNVNKLFGFGAVGAAPGLDNPVQVALAIARAAEVSS
jgi:taspase (threonine aspartase 1)